MALAIKQLTNYSWMSQASYLDFTGLSNGSSGDSLKSKLKGTLLNGDKIFADEQANFFTDPTDGFSFVSYQPNKDSGFSATVFQSNVDGSYTFAVRGTEPDFLSPADLVEDVLGVVLAGKAASQAIDAYRYYKQLTSTGTSHLYSQEELNKLTGLYLQTPAAILQVGDLENAITIFQSELQNDAGLGLISAEAKINFTGHSLGGHVAVLLAELVAQQDGVARVGDIATYNAPGMNSLPYEIVNWFTAFGATSIQTGILGQKHIAIVGEGGLDVTAGLGQINGQLQKTYIEDSGVISGNLGMANHSIVKLSDSFAIRNVFATLDPATNLTLLDTFIKQSSNTHEDSLEKTLDALRKTILGDSIASTVVSGSEDAAARDSLYTHIQELADNSTFQALAGKVTLEAPPTSASEARTDLGLFLSLYYLTPFALKTDGSIVADAQLTIANPDIATQFKDDKLLTPEQITNGEANFSDMYLNDRAAMLSWVNKRNKDDLQTSAGQQVANNGLPNAVENASQRYYFQDITSETELYLSTSEDRQKFIFGAINDEAGTTAINGGANEDHLYGMSGADTLNGGKGNDWLEGGADNGFMFGGLAVMNGGWQHERTDTNFYNSAMGKGSKSHDCVFYQGDANKRIYAIGENVGVYIDICIAFRR